MIERYMKEDYLIIMVGDGGFEPPTSTMSTWRSTPELIAQKIWENNFLINS